MPKQEVDSFILEISAVEKLLHYLPMDIIEEHIVDIVKESKIVDALEIPDDEKLELRNTLITFKNILEHEIKLRSKSV